MLKCEQLLSNKSISFLKLNYEEHIENNPDRASQLVSNFLGVKFHEGRINFIKTNPYKIKDILSNYEEVKEHLKGTKYEWMVYE